MKDIFKNNQIFLLLPYISSIKFINKKHTFIYKLPLENEIQKEILAHWLKDYLLNDNLYYKIICLVELNFNGTKTTVDLSSIINRSEDGYNR